MNYKAVSCKRVIDKVFGAYGNLLSQHTDRLIGESIVWAGDALESIGSVINLEDKTAYLTITNGKTPLPCDLHLIKSVSYRGHWLRYGSQTFNYNLHCDDCINATISEYDFSYTVNPNYINTNIEDKIEITFKDGELFRSTIDQKNLPHNYFLSTGLPRQIVITSNQNN
jgi:hypothetical protein